MVIFLQVTAADYYANWNLSISILIDKTEKYTIFGLSLDSWKVKKSNMLKLDDFSKEFVNSTNFANVN